MEPPSDTVSLVLPDGRRIQLDDDVVIGRAPVAPDNSPAARSVSLVAPTVSKTHALIGRTAGVVWLVDLHSSNGSEIVDGSGTATTVVPGVTSTIPPGSHLRLGTDVVVTVDRPVAGVDDTTVVRAPAPVATIVPPQPGTDGRPLPAASAAVDWSVVMEPARGAPMPSSARQPGPGTHRPPPQPPSPQPPSPQPPSPGSPVAPSAPAFSPSSPPTAQVAAVMPAAQPGQFGMAVPPQVSGAPTSRRSPAHIVGALVLLGWGLVGGWRLLEIGPDVLLENLSGWPARFFALVSRDEFEFIELFSFVPTPNWLSPIVYVFAAAVVVTAFLAVIVPSRTVRFLAIATVGLELFLIAGFAVDFFVAVGAESLEFVLPNFVVPLIGAGLLLWPTRSPGGPSVAFAPQSSPGVFYAPQQPPPPPGAPPFGGPS